MCQSPRIAVQTYQHFGDNVGEMNQPYNKELLHESVCNLISEKSDHPLKIKRFETGNIATSNGWVSVTDVTFPANGMTYSGYIASQYLRGECTHYDASNPDLPDGRRSPYLPSVPKGGYAVPNMGAMP
jgi:hypothetical protein